MSGEVKMKRRDRTVFRAAALAAFLLIMSTVILLSVRADLDYGRNRLSRVVEYVAKRCDAYSLSSTASETRSLMRVMEAAKQAGIKQASGKRHMAPVPGAAGEAPYVATPRQKEMYREINPNATDDEINAAYGEFYKQ
mgnify:CR=1 FL=1